MDRFLCVLPRGSGGKKRPASSTCISPPTDRPPPKARKLVQHFIDIGQKHFGAPILCQKCGMLYVNDDEEDNRRHRELCNKVNNAPLLSAKNLSAASELYVAEDESERIIVSSSGDKKLVGEVQSKIFPELEKDFESSPEFLLNSFLPTSKIFLYMRKAVVVGLLIAESVQSPQVRYLQSCDDRTEESIHEPAENLRCSSFMGVRLIWVHSSARRRNVASKMVDWARQDFVFGQVVPVEMVCFSQPTTVGFQFARWYLTNQRDAARSTAENNPPQSVPCYV